MRYVSIYDLKHDSILYKLGIKSSMYKKVKRPDTGTVFKFALRQMPAPR
jgi:hypothetical protein